MTCAHCGAPIKYNRFAHGWLHELPLGELRVSRREADDIRRDPPRSKEVLHRQTLLHPAESKDYSVHNPRRSLVHDL